MVWEGETVKRRLIRLRCSYCGKPLDAAYDPALWEKPPVGVCCSDACAVSFQQARRLRELGRL
jgi:hypothetical protein